MIWSGDQWFSGSKSQGGLGHLAGLRIDLILLKVVQSTVSRTQF